MSDRIAEIRELLEKSQQSGYCRCYHESQERECHQHGDSIARFEGDLTDAIAYLLERLSALSDALDREKLAAAIWQATTLGREVVGWDDVRRSAYQLPGLTAAASVALTYERADAVRRHVLGEEQG